MLRPAPPDDPRPARRYDDWDALDSDEDNCWACLILLTATVLLLGFLAGYGTGAWLNSP